MFTDLSDLIVKWIIGSILLLVVLLFYINSNDPSMLWLLGIVGVCFVVDIAWYIRNRPYLSKASGDFSEWRPSPPQSGCCGQPFLVSTDDLVLLGKGESESGTKQVDSSIMMQLAFSFLRTQSWCKEIKEAYKAYPESDLGNAIGVFYFRFLPSQPDIDKELWIVVGDTSPAYFTCDKADTPLAVLKLYAYEMTLWVKAVEQGLPVIDLIPVTYVDCANRVKPTLESASSLNARVHFIERFILQIEAQGDTRG